MATAEINRTRLFYTTVGSGDPCLTMHGVLGLDHTFAQFSADAEPLRQRLDLGKGRPARALIWRLHRARLRPALPRVDLAADPDLDRTRRRLLAGDSGEHAPPRRDGGLASARSLRRRWSSSAARTCSPRSRRRSGCTVESPARPASRRAVSAILASVACLSERPAAGGRPRRSPRCRDRCSSRCPRPPGLRC